MKFSPEKRAAAPASEKYDTSLETTWIQPLSADNNAFSSSDQSVDYSREISGSSSRHNVSSEKSNPNAEETRSGYTVKKSGAIPALRRLLDTEGKLADIAANSTHIMQTTFEDPSLYYYRFVYEDRQISQTYSRLPKYMCYTLNWKGNPEMNSYHEYPPLFEFLMYVQWRLDEQVALDEFELTMGFHSIEVINAGEVHSMILRPNGNYEFSTQMSVTRLLPPPYDTNGQ
ncbi:hypothetical protein BIW11_03939 [Tropilaelaps mercedesae]|uniref:Uncharacterized protein n=1 Tax=Tropilaelaps mercedesae TaxID=418985 RepID=A0A1V9XDV4_9ACAR|nr:hypothetical protein BIW11_03939 [Tropilaelaps mercedesae]